MGRGLAVGIVVAAVLASAGAAAPTLTPLGTDPYVNPDSQHATMVEPDSFAFGSTIVAAVQSGRFYDGGGSNISWATSTNAGASWTTGTLPGTTVNSTPPGPYARLTDPSVAYDAKHDRWLIAGLALSDPLGGVAVTVSASDDGGLTWQNPVEAATATDFADFDKDWIVCDNTPASPFYGSCYAEYDDFGNGNLVHVAYSRDGGVTWAEGNLPGEGVIGGQPIVQPSGTVLMPIDDGFETELLSFTSTDGGVTWTEASKPIASLEMHRIDGDLRGDALPSADVDASGRAYVVWPDCRFRKNCAANDIVLSTLKGKKWSKPVRIPIAAKKSTEDDFLPGVVVDPSTSGTTAQIGLVYYYHPETSCSDCDLYVGFVQSKNGGKSWTPPVQLAGPMDHDWLPQTSQGRMVGDYMSVSFAGGLFLPFFVNAHAPTAGGNDCETATPNCDVAMVTTAGIAPSRGTVATSTNDRVVGSAPARRGGRAKIR